MNEIDRAHTITATPMANGRGGLQYHCTTCGTLTYFQPPTLPCLGSLSEAHATIERLQQQVTNALAEVKRLEDALPCDGGCSPETGGPQEDCSRHGRDPKDLWRIIGELSDERDHLRSEIDSVEEAIIEAAYAQVSLDKCLTVLPISEYRMNVPPHWREAAIARAKLYLGAVREVINQPRADQ